MADWLALLVLGGFVGLDATSFPQMMFSRPLVAGALAGAVFGQPVAGVLVGGILEVFDVAILPIGAARYPEGGTAAIAAAAAYISSGSQASGPGALLIALVFGLAWERVAGSSVVFARRVNEMFLVRETSKVAVDRQVERRQALAMLVDFLRGALITLAGIVVGTALVATLGPLWTFGPNLTLGAITAGGALVLAGTLDVFGGWSERRTVFLLGLICGSVALLLLT